MRPAAICLFLALIVCGSALVPSSAQESVDDASGARLFLAKQELTKNADGTYIVATETKLAKFVEGLPDLQKNIGNMESAKSKFIREYQQKLQQSMTMEQQYQQVTSQLSKVANPQQKTQMTAFQKDLGTKKAALLKDIAQLPQHHNTHDLQVHQARKAFIDGITAAKKQADETTTAYDKLKKNPLVEKSVKLLSQSEGKEYKLGPGAEFTKQLERLKKAEDQIVRLEIDLEPDGKTYLGEIVVNGKQKLKFQVSPVTRATMLSEEAAAQLGVVIPPGTPKVPFTVSKDERLSVPEIVFPNLALGDFKSPFVRAMVLPKAHAAVPSVGANFFNGTVYQLDAKNKKLKITKLKD